MAGIGFELKKLFQKKGVLNTAKAYGYATVTCAGPMLLGILLLLGIMGLCSVFEVPVLTRELLVSMITYTLLCSVLVTAFFSMVVTRYVADMLFEDKKWKTKFMKSEVYRPAFMKGKLRGLQF